jgi:hypothetical protein
MSTDERGALGSRSTIRDKIIAIIVVLLQVPLLTIISHHKVLSPFSLPDPSFALFFLLLAVSCIVSYLLLEFEKSVALHPLLQAAFPIKATIFQLAYFLFDRNRAIQTAIVDLVRRKLLVVTKDKLFLVYKEQYIQSDNEQNPLIPALLKEERTCITYDRIVYVWQYKKHFEHPVLQPIQLLADHRKIFQKRYGLLLLPVIVGVARYLQPMTDYLASVFFWEALLLGVLYLVLIKQVSCGSMMRWKARQLLSVQRETVVLYPYSIVTNFALEGSDAINRYSDGLALIEIFKLGPFIDRVSEGAGEHGEEDEYILWSSDGRRGWSNHPENIMKEIENESLTNARSARYIF